MTKRETPFKFYAQGEDGRWFLTMGGKRIGWNDRTYATEAEVKERWANWVESSDQADDDERRFGVQ